MRDHRYEKDRSRPAGTVAGIVLMLACLIGPPRSGTPHHRFHNRSERARPELAGPLEATEQLRTRRWPFVPVSVEPPPSGLFYAVTASDVAAALDDLPREWRETVRAVRLSPDPEGEVMAETDGRTIQIHYVVDQLNRTPVTRGEDTEEEEEFGGIPERQGRRRWVYWPDRSRLQTYVLKHLLIHEIGHHLAPSDLAEEADEQWAEDFAFRFYEPAPTRREPVEWRADEDRR